MAQSLVKANIDTAGLLPGQYASMASGQATSLAGAGDVTIITAVAWASGTTYTAGQGAVGSDTNFYVANIGSTGVQPVGDGTGTWTLVTTTPQSVAVVNPPADTVSTASLVLATGGTVTAGATQAVRVNPAGAVTGVIIAPGTVNGENVKIINESAFTVTFAAAGTSYVADGTSDVIAALRVGHFMWDGATSLWYRMG